MKPYEKWTLFALAVLMAAVLWWTYDPAIAFRAWWPHPR